MEWLRLPPRWFQSWVILLLVTTNVLVAGPPLHTAYRVSRLPPTEFQAEIEKTLPSPPITELTEHLRKGTSEPRQLYGSITPRNTNWLSASESKEYTLQSALKRAGSSPSGLFIYELRGQGVQTPYAKNPIYQIDPADIDYENRSIDKWGELTPPEFEITFFQGDKRPEILSVLYVDTDGQIHEKIDGYPVGAKSKLPDWHKGLRKNYTMKYPQLPRNHEQNRPDWAPKELFPAPPVTKSLSASPSYSQLSFCGGIWQQLLRRTKQLIPGN